MRDRKEYYKTRYQNNKKRLDEQCKSYRKSPEGKKTHIVGSWKHRGIIDEDLRAVYDYLIVQTHCMICLKEYTSTHDRCVDHDHITGEIRYIVCRKCNSSVLREN